MKILLEIFVSILLHPIAMVLMWINVLGRNDLNALQKIAWIIIGVVWGIGPLLYVFFGGGELW